MLRIICGAIFLALVAMPALAADDILDAIEAARKAYQAGDMAGAKQSLDLASQLVGQKNAENFAALLPEALPGWKAEKVEATSVGVTVFGVTSASRRYTGPDGRDVQVRITGDSALVLHFARTLYESDHRRRHGQAHQHRRPACAADQRGLDQYGRRRQVPGHGGGFGRRRHQAHLCRAVDIAKLSKM